MGPHVLDLGSQGRFSDEAVFDINHQAVVGSDKPDVQPLLEFVPLAANHDSITITIGLRTWDHRRHNRLAESSDTLQKGADLFVLQFELRPVRDMLVLATATIAEIA